MNLPSYMTIICNFSGDVLQCPDEISIKSIFDIIEPTSLNKFQEYVRDILKVEKCMEIKSIKLIDGKIYWVNVETYNGFKLCFYFSEMTLESMKHDKFWTDVVFKYDYYLTRARNVVRCTSKLIENLFYKNRSDIYEIIKTLCSALKIQYSLLLFHNGYDHIIYGHDDMEEFKIDELDKDLKFSNDSFDKDVKLEINPIFKIKKYKDTYFAKFKNIEQLEKKDVYILKLMFGPKEIGYLELIPHTNVLIAKTELVLIQSLSNVLAYVINNKCEQQEIEKYIRESFTTLNTTTN